MKEARQPLSTDIVQPIFHGIIKFTTSEILQEGLGRFTITRKWTRQFKKQYMN
jgi:hypothetical protein